MVTNPIYHSKRINVGMKIGEGCIDGSVFYCHKEMLICYTYIRLRNNRSSVNFMVSSSDVDECLSSPCENGGSCANLMARYTCSCIAGWSGTNCQAGMYWKHMNSHKMFYWFVCMDLYGPLTRYVKLRVVHAPGMPGTFPPPPTPKESAS